MVWRLRKNIPIRLRSRCKRAGENTGKKGAIAVRPSHWFFARRGFMHVKKTAHAIEQARPDVLRQREDWFDGQIDLHPDRLVFIDKTRPATNMARTHGRCRKGERLRMAVPHGHRKTTTFIAGLRNQRDGRPPGA